MGELDVIATVATSIAVDEQNRYLDWIGAVPVSRSWGTSSSSAFTQDLRSSSCSLPGAFSAPPGQAYSGW